MRIAYFQHPKWLAYESELWLWNPLTRVVIVTAGFYCGIRELFEEIADGVVKSNKAKQKYFEAKENGWLLD